MGQRLAKPELVRLKGLGAFFPRPRLSEESLMSLPAIATSSGTSTSEAEPDEP